MSLSSLYLDAFYTCARTGHFTKAAADLSITQSALSQRIAKLEAELGTSLFTRQSSGIKLTPAGEELLRYCKTRDELERCSIDKIRGTNSNQLSGVIRIGGFSSVMRSVILPSLSPLIKMNPQLKLQLISKEMIELPALLRRSEIDYMVHYEELIRDDVETLLLGREKNVLVEKKGYNGPSIFLDHDENDQTTAKYLKLIKSKKNYQRRYLDEVYGLIDGVKNDLGRALVPEHLIKKEKELSIVDKKNHLIFPVILHYFKQPYYSELHHQILECLIKGCKTYLS